MSITEMAVIVVAFVIDRLPTEMVPRYITGMNDRFNGICNLASRAQSLLSDITFIPPFQT